MSASRWLYRGSCRAIAVLPVAALSILLGAVISIVFIFADSAHADVDGPAIAVGEAPIYTYDIHAGVELAVGADAAAGWASTGNTLGVVVGASGSDEPPLRRSSEQAAPTSALDDLVEVVPGGPKSSPNFKPPTNSPSLPPTEIPPGWRVREMPPSVDYPDGYWKLEKPMANGGWQPIDPSTMNPGSRPETHVPFPAGD